MHLSLNSAVAATLDNAEPAIPGKRPNILFILSDDHGQWAAGTYGNEEIVTPNLDQLAETGLRFDNFFCATPVCSPSRATFLTGRVPSQHGIHDWLRDASQEAGGEIDETVYLEGEIAYTDILKTHGYRLGLSGKWHLGASRIPQHGFDDWFVHQYGGGLYRNAPMIRNGERVSEPGYVTDVITDEALRLMREYAAGDQPWYLSVHYTAPHSPWIGDRAGHPREYLDLYRDTPFVSAPQETVHPWAEKDWLTRNHLGNREALAGYYAAVTAMDFNIGRLLRQLEDLGLLENTLVVYASDNGMATGHRGFWGKGNGTTPRNMYDLTTKIPFIVSQPGTIPGGKASSHLLSAYDFFPTLLEHAGIAVPEDDRNRPGRSFASLLRGEELPEDGFVCIYDEYGPVRMIRTLEDKLVRRYPEGPDEFYLLSVDPEERDNRIDDPEQQDRIRELDERLEAFFSAHEERGMSGRALDGTQKGQTEKLNRGGACKTPANAGFSDRVSGFRNAQHAVDQQYPS